jgi:hypothetical protein
VFAFFGKKYSSILAHLHFRHWGREITMGRLRARIAQGDRFGFRPRRMVVRF